MPEEPLEPQAPKPEPVLLPAVPGTDSGVRRGVLVACSIIALLIAVGGVIGIFALSSFLQKPEARKVLRQAARAEICKRQLFEIDGAIRRYRIAHQDSYPKSLDDLGGFLSDRRILICPEDTDRRSGCSYTYQPPGPKDRNPAWIVCCDRHNRMGIPIRLTLTLDHKVIEERP